MDLGSFIKLAVGIPLGMYAILVIIDAYLLRQHIEFFRKGLGSLMPKKMNTRLFLYYARYSLMLKTIRYHIAMRRAVRAIRRYESELSEENEGFPGT